MVRRMGMGVAAVLVVALALPAGEPAGKKLQGTWTRTAADSTYEFKFLPDTLLFTSEGPLGKLIAEVDYATTKDGKNVYGRVRTVKEGVGPAKGDLLTFAFTV